MLIDQNLKLAKLWDPGTVRVNFIIVRASGGRTGEKYRVLKIEAGIRIDEKYFS